MNANHTRSGTVCYDAVVDFTMRDFSLDVRPWESLALVGPSGAGKSTLFQLLLRFYDPERGTVRLDGVDVKRVDLRASRRHIALVSQEPAVFAASVAGNVRYGRPDASDEEVRRACDAAFATKFVGKLPQGFDTWLDERGVRLSGGQRQRLAIARAILVRAAHPVAGRGRLVGVGSHDELLTGNPLYARLAALQFGA